MPSNSQTKKFLTVAEFAQLTGDSQSTIRREIRAGSLPYQQSGPKKKIRIPIEALEIRSVPSVETELAQMQHPEKAGDHSETLSGPNPKWMG